MKQLLQSLNDGSTELADVPVPMKRSGESLIKTSKTLVSSGTERMLVEFGKSNMIQKARSQPDKVKMVLEKARTDGVLATYDAVKSKLDQPLALGYCNVGRIVETSIPGLSIGDRVVTNGPHAEYVAVPKNLTAKIPENVSDEEAAFTVLASIGLQGIRLAAPTLGETFIVTGLGLVGLLTVQMLLANGCRVIGIDLDPERQKLAQSFGAEILEPGDGADMLANVLSLTNGIGVDGVIITASTTSNEPISQAAKFCRQRGRIILIGVIGLELNRADFYEKEITFQVSCSYGPGRYDPLYEDMGHDYPLGYVRWTEQRNFCAVLNMMAQGQLNVSPLISHRFSIQEGAEAMNLLTSSRPSLGILIEFLHSFDEPNIKRTVQLRDQSLQKSQIGAGVTAFLGAGNYAGRILIPAFKKAGARLEALVSKNGMSSVHSGRKYGFLNASTDEVEVLSNKQIDTVVIATRHNLHAQQILSSLAAGKHVFCEKPLCLTLNELSRIKAACEKSHKQQLMIGFNRRFSPFTVKMKELLSKIQEPKAIVITVNAGAIPSEHWIQDPLVGGGRIIGECCHFIDLARHLVDEKIIDYGVHSLEQGQHLSFSDDKISISLKFEDGSLATIHYFANGHNGFPKERVEVFAGGKVLQLDNFRKLTGWGWSNFRKMKSIRQNKGQLECARAFIEAVKCGKQSPISSIEMMEVSEVTIKLAEIVRN